MEWLPEVRQARRHAKKKKIVTVKTEQLIAANFLLLCVLQPYKAKLISPPAVLQGSNDLIMGASATLVLARCISGTSILQIRF
jgi:hypothetical protein